MTLFKFDETAIVCFHLSKYLAHALTSADSTQIRAALYPVLCVSCEIHAVLLRKFRTVSISSERDHFTQFLLKIIDKAVPRTSGTRGDANEDIFWLGQLDPRRKDVDIEPSDVNRILIARDLFILSAKKD